MSSENRALRRLKEGWADKRLICVGLDPDSSKLPRQLVEASQNKALDSLLGSCQTSIKASRGRALAYKPNVAFFAGFGAPGVSLLKKLIEELRRDEELPVILDYKRGDIGNTNRGYVQEAIEYYGADGITLNPYLGMEANAPFLALTDTVLFFLCKTSNEGSGEFQDRSVELTEEEAEAFGFDYGDMAPFHQVVAHRIASKWNVRGNCGLVVGATYTADLARVRHLANDLPILAPGVGTQGGDLEATVRSGVIAGRGAEGLLINIGSGIMYAPDPPTAFTQYDRAAQAALAACAPR